MPDYKAMYFELARAQGKAINALLEASNILVATGLITEEMFLQSKDPMRLPKSFRESANSVVANNDTANPAK